ncbi:sugar isomerase, partial [Campylobacter coli]|nr:sugar isomerase [Campylobacter coli]
MKNIKDFTKEYIFKLNQLLDKIDENIVADIVHLFEQVSK